MSKLLSLVDKLIGNVLAGNIYTDISQYSALFPQQPDSIKNIPTSHEINPGNIPVSETPQPLEVRREIYRKKETIRTGDSVLDDLIAFHQEREADQSFSKGQAFSETKRREIYIEPDSNVGGSTFPKGLYGGENSGIEANQGDSNMAAGRLPAPLLTFQNQSEAPDLSKISGHPEGVIEQFQGEPGIAYYERSNNSRISPDNVPIQGQLENKSVDNKFGNDYSSTSPYSLSGINPADFLAIAHWMRNVGREVFFVPREQMDPITKQPSTDIPIRKSIGWLASQFLLASFNPTDPLGPGVTNAVWNPLSFPLTAIPFAGRATIAGFTPAAPTVGAAAGFDYKTNTQTSAATGTERLVLMYKGKYVQTPNASQISKFDKPLVGFIGDTSKVGEYDTLQSPGVGPPIATTIEGGLETETARRSFGSVQTNIYTPGETYKDQPVLPLEKLENKLSPILTPEGVKLNELYDKKGWPGGGRPFYDVPYVFQAKPFLSQDRGWGNLTDAPGLNAAITDVAFNTLDQDKGILPAEAGLAEGEIYMPFMFEDLRQPLPELLYFRAFLKPGLSETFTVEWQNNRFYGRVDQIPVYMGAMRNINLSFDVVAWSPKDLSVMYKKMEKLQSMVYPFYDEKGFYSAGPIVRMRVGDLIAGKNNRGLPGYITSMDWSYDDGIWNIKENEKVPRKISVSLGFTVLHEGNPGTLKMQDGTFKFGAIKPDKDGDKMEADISEIRKIFAEVRNK